MNLVRRLIVRFLRSRGFVRCDYGFRCGRHWVSIDGFVVAQTSGDDCWMHDEDVHRLGYVCLDHGKHWTIPDQRAGEGREQ